MSPESVADDEEDDIWDEDWGENDESQCTSLFSNVVLPSVEACCDHDATQHGFDLRSYCAQHALDDYGVLKCINYIRRTVADGTDPLPSLKQGPEAFADDKYLQPILEDDGLLCHDFTEGQDGGSAQNGAVAETALQGRVQQLEAEKAALLDALAELRTLAVPQELQAEARAAQGGASTSQMPAPPDGTQPRSTAPPASTSAAAAKDVDRAYFGSYSYFDIHREMLEDTTRTNAYRRALEENPTLMSGATVLDVGCGTGVLSMFAARGGAARVVGVDAAPKIVPFAVKNCVANALHESVGGPVAILSGKAEELEALPGVDGRVDVLVSEWMGYALLFESMLDSVLRCRDRWLKPGGAMLPDRAAMYVAAGSEVATGLTFWDDVYGLKFPAIREEIASTTRTQPHVAPVDSKALLSDAAVVKEFDLTTMEAADADFHADFELAVARGGACCALVLWFDTTFSERFCVDAPGVLSTSPAGKQTHWVQTVFLLDSAIEVSSGETLRCRCSFANSGKHRSLDISFEVEQVLADGGTGARAAQAYVMEVSAMTESD